MEEDLGDHDGKIESGQERISCPPLSFLALKTICTHLERYAPESFAVLSEEEYETLIQLRHVITKPVTKTCTKSKSCVATKQKPSHTPSPTLMLATAAAAPSPSPSRNIKTNNNGMAKNSGGIDGTGRMIPAIPARIMKAIEQANEHLSQSVIADVLVWKDNVEYSFRRENIMMRPKPMLVPWPLLVQEIKNAGEELMTILNVDLNDKKQQSSNAGDEDNDQRIFVKSLADRLNDSIRIFCRAPMSVELLLASGIGKVVKKFVKECAKRKEHQQDQQKRTKGIGDKYGFSEVDRMISEGTISQCGSNASLLPTHDGPSRVCPQSPLMQLEQLLQSWKDVASASGVVINHTSPQKPLPTAVGDHDATIAGRCKGVTEAQYRADLIAIQQCSSWRDLYAALEKRREKTKLSFGANVRAKRDDLQSGRARIKSVSIRSKRARSSTTTAVTVGNRCSTGGNCNAAPGSSRVASLRLETAVQAAHSKTGVQKRGVNSTASSSIFGFAIANANTQSKIGGPFKRPLDLRKGEVALGGGKRLKMPTKKTNVDRDVGFGVFSSLKEKSKKDIKKHGPVMKSRPTDGKKGKWMKR